MTLSYFITLRFAGVIRRSSRIKLLCVDCTWIYTRKTKNSINEEVMNMDNRKRESIMMPISCQMLLKTTIIELGYSILKSYTGYLELFFNGLLKSDKKGILEINLSQWLHDTSVCGEILYLFSVLDKVVFHHTNAHPEPFQIESNEIKDVRRSQFA